MTDEAPIDQGNPWDKVREISQKNEALRAELERLRAAYDSRGGEMDSMRMVLAQTQKWNEDSLAEIKRLQQENADLRRWKALDKPITAAMNVVNNDVQSLRAEIKRLRAEAADRIKKVECLWALCDARKNEIARLQSCLHAQESVPQLYAEIKRLRLAGDAAFHAMCAYRDSRDEEVFQGAIDELGSALKDTAPRHEPKTKAPGS